MSEDLRPWENFRLALAKTKPNDDLCTATDAMVFLYDLGLDDDFAEVGWHKLATRRYEDVRRFYNEAKEAKPEQRQRMLTEFAKTHKATDRRLSA